MELSFWDSPFRFLNVLLQPVTVFIIHVVLQNYFPGWLRMLQRNLREILLMGFLLLVPFIIVASVKDWKILWILSCSLLFVDVVQRHIIVNVCQGESYFIMCILFSFYNFNQFSNCFFQRN